MRLDKVVLLQDVDEAWVNSAKEGFHYRRAKTITNMAQNGTSDLKHTTLTKALDY
ncbi:hypothetical protein LTR16_010021, partial [Cryomyces antarcticus]